MISVLFVTIFAVAAVYIAFIFIMDVQAVERARNWIETPAKVIHYELAEGASSLSLSLAAREEDTTEYINAEYSYAYNGKNFTGKRVDFTNNHADNFSQDRRARQMRILAKGDIVVYVNPERPEEAVVDRSLPAERMLFLTIFLLFPCGFATMVVVFSLLSPFKAIYLYAPQIWGTLHSLPALWLLLRYPSEYGLRGLILLTLISAIVPFAVYRVIVKFKAK